MNKTLYEIGDDLSRIADLLDDPEVSVADLDAALLDYMTQTKLELEEKVDRYCGLIRELELRARTREQEATRLRVLSERDFVSSARLRTRLFQFFEAHAIPRLETPRFSLKVVNNGGLAPLVIPDPNAVPEDYCRVKVEPDNATIRMALDSGKELEFAFLGSRGRSLRIK